MSKQAEMNFKEKVYLQCLQLIADKVTTLQAMLDDLRESEKNETKSTAGDKHETARAHLQLEQENVRRQLKEISDQKTALEQLNVNLVPVAVAKGSLVKTDKGYFFIGVAIGKVMVNELTVFALSPQSPLGIKLMGSKPGSTIKMNDTTYFIECIN